MKIKYLFIGLLFVILGVSVYFLVCVFNKNIELNKKYNEVNDSIKQNEIDKELYLSKKKELDELKEENKDKVLKYEEVVGWNEEIVKYLD